jgi:hypothetical protein
MPLEQFNTALAGIINDFGKKLKASARQACSTSR